MIDISEVSRQSGTTTSKIRYYEEIGLIHSVGRKGQRRVFKSDVLSRLSLIALGQIAGFSLTEIRDMLGTEARPAIDRDRLTERADALDQHIKTMSALRDGLRHAAGCTAPSHLECPEFQRLMRIAQRRQTPRRPRLKPS